MLITELKTIEYLEFVKRLFRDNNYKFLLLSVARYGDNKRYFLELEEFWSSLDNLTADKIVFLNFSSNINRKVETDNHYFQSIYGERIISKEIQPFRQYDLLNLFENVSYGGRYYREQIEKNDDSSNSFLRAYYSSLQSVRLKYLPSLEGKLNQNISESATQLLNYLDKKESDIPFIYLFDLQKGDEYFFRIEDIYVHYTNFYTFIQALKIRIEEEERLNADIRKCKKNINEIEYKYDLDRREDTLKRKLKQLNRIPAEMSAIETYIQNNELTIEQRYYLESIVKRENYELKYPLKNLFPPTNLLDTNINSIILKYSNKRIQTLETDLENWIMSETIKLETDRVDSQTQIDELRRKINGYNKEVNLLYNNLFFNNNSINNRKMNEFKVAFTFSGENRGYVEEVAVELESKIGKGNLFYDNFFQAELARINLDVFLQDIYHNKSDFIVVFLSKTYEHKQWCGLEWRSIRDLIKRKQSDKIILVKLEDFNLDGIFSIDGYLDGSKNNPTTIAELIHRRISI
jgi:hypothetical protein